MAKVKIILNGASGKMGQEISRLLRGHARAELSHSVTARGASAWANVRASAGSVVIDFSSPAGMLAAAKWCAKNRVPLVSGTTGLTEAQFKRLSVTSRKTAVLWSPNTSVGINLFIKIIEAIGSGLDGFDLQIEEFHHAMKKDSPSGTAKLLQAAAERVLKKKLPPALSGRGGGIIGTHKLSIMGSEEVLTIEHVALNRGVFARGAIDAAIWLVKKSRGRYTMADVLNARA
jgi:4-hydroxy-tetrahydrodipicolinate reductase